MRSDLLVRLAFGMALVDARELHSSRWSRRTVCARSRSTPANNLRWSRRTICATALAMPSRAWSWYQLPENLGSSGDTMEALMRQKLCIAALPNRATYNWTSHAAISPAKATVGCVNHGSSLQIYAADVHVKSSTSPLRSFTAEFTVPPSPAATLYSGQHVFFWPGLKAEAPEMGYPVLQPVLQYDMRGYTLQSWFVDAAHQTVVTAPAVAVAPGDRISSHIDLSMDGSIWTVSGKNAASGQDSTLHIADCPVVFDHAMLVNENINVYDHCARMPASMSERTSITFTNVAVNDERALWTTRARCAGNELCDCGNAADVAANGDVTLSWRARGRARERF